MAKGFRFSIPICVPDRCIAIDKSGVPWVIDPESGTIRLATIDQGDGKQLAVKPKKRK